MSDVISMLKKVLIVVISLSLLADPAWARGFGGGGRGGGGGRMGGGGGGFNRSMPARGGGGFSGGGMSRPAPQMNRPAPQTRPQQSRPQASRPQPQTRPAPSTGGGSSRPNTSRPNTTRPNVVQRPSTRPSTPHVSNTTRPAPGRPPVSSTRPSTRPGVTPSTRPEIRPGGGDLTSRPAVRPETRPGGTRPPIGTEGGTRPGTRPNVRPEVRPETRPGTRPETLPGVRPETRPAGPRPETLPGTRPGLSGEGTRPGIRPETLPGTRPAERPGLRPETRPSERPNRPETFPGTRPSERPGNWENHPNTWDIPDRHQDLAGRFDTLESHWNDPGWHHNQWTGPNGGEFNHMGFWGPNGYWGHSGYWGPNGGYWGHTGAAGPHGGWGHSSYWGPAGHWSRSWNWYNGYGPTWGHCHWGYLWNEYPVTMAFGATMWGLNVVNSAFGVSSYYNPYASAPVYVNNQQVVSYSTPIAGDPSYLTEQTAMAESVPTEQPVDAGSAEAPPAETAETPAAPDPLTEDFDAARDAFYDGHYDQALSLTNQALAQAPRDAAINEFRSLCLFALGQYSDAAGTIHAVLAAGPGWDWTTLISLYGNKDDYTTQLRKLEAAIKADPKAADAQFLLAYHYITAGHQENAVTLLKKVSELEPKDKLSSDLVKMYTPQDEEAEAQPASETPPPELDEPAYPLEKLQGDWAAKNDSGEFSMSLAKDDAFTWKFSHENQQQEMTGAYVIRGNYLVMQPDTGGTLISEITLKDDKTLEFVPAGDATTLTFTR